MKQKSKKISRDDVVDLILKNRNVKKLRLDKEQLTLIIDTFVSIVKKNVKKNIKVSIYGLGVFWKSGIKKRIGINPQTGEKIEIEKKIIPRFTASKAFKEWR